MSEYLFDNLGHRTSKQIHEWIEYHYPSMDEYYREVYEEENDYDRIQDWSE